MWLGKGQRVCYGFGAGFCEYEMVLLQGSETGLIQGPMPDPSNSLSPSLSLASLSSLPICLKTGPIPRRQEFQEFKEIWESRPRQGAFMSFLLSVSTSHVDRA